MDAPAKPAFCGAFATEGVAKRKGFGSEGAYAPEAPETSPCRQKKAAAEIHMDVNFWTASEASEFIDGPG
jgi:hypothetical protein